MTLPERRPINLRQLCSIARTVLEANPAISDSEWKAASREKAARQGYDEATPAMLDDAMSRVERATKRPAPMSPTVPASRGPESDTPLNPAEASLFLATIRQRAAQSLKPGSESPPFHHSARGLTSLAMILAGQSSPSGPNRTAEQIAAWRAETPRTAEFVKTVRGWEKRKS